MSQIPKLHSMQAQFLLVFLIILITPISAQNEEFGVEPGDVFSFTLLQGDNNVIPGKYVISNLKGEYVTIPVGSVFTASPESLRVDGSTFVRIIPVEISNGTNSITIDSEISGNGFFVSLNWNGNINVDEGRNGGQKNLDIINTVTEIGYNYTFDLNVINGSFNTTDHTQLIRRFSKTDGALNYLYFENFHIFNNSNEGGVHREERNIAEYIRGEVAPTTSEVAPTTSEVLLKIPVNFSMVILALMCLKTVRYRSKGYHFRF